MKGSDGLMFCDRWDFRSLAICDHYDMLPVFSELSIYLKNTFKFIACYDCIFMEMINKNY